MVATKAPARFGIVRAIVLALAGALAIAAAVFSLPAIVHPPGVFGWNVGPDGVTVISITRGYPADRAGIKPGDQIVYGTMNLRARLNAILASPDEPYERMTFALRRAGGIRTVSLSAVQWPQWLWGLVIVSGTLAGLAFVGVAIALVALRPSAMTWGFLVASTPALVPFNAYNFHPDAAMAVVLAAQGVASGISAAGAFVFVSRFPAGEPGRLTVWLDRAALPWSIAVTVGWVYAVWLLVVSPAPPPHWLLIGLEYAIPTLGSLVTIAALGAAYADAQGVMRQRILPVFVSIAVSAFLGLGWTIVNQLTTDPTIVLGCGALTEFSTAAIPLCVLYAIVRHRVIDVNFVVSRTLVYSVLTATIVVSYALVHHFVAKVLEHARLSTLIELAVAIGYGVWLKVIYEKIDDWLDSVLFRRRHAAATHLNRIAEALPQANSDEQIDTALIVEPADAFSLASAAVFHREPDGSYARRAASGWPAGGAAAIAADDPLLAQLRAELAPIDLGTFAWRRSDLPEGLAAPMYAIPIAVRNEIEAVAVYGGHAGGEALDPDETRILRDLCSAAAVAYEYVEMNRLRATVRELRAENEGLQRAQGALEEATRRLNAEIAALARLSAAADPPA